MSPKERHRKVCELKLCFKCLKGKHFASDCKHPNPRLCKMCNRGHNYLLHVDDTFGTGPAAAAASSSRPTADNSNSISDLHKS